MNGVLADEGQGEYLTRYMMLYGEGGYIKVTIPISAHHPAPRSLQEAYSIYAHDWADEDDWDPD